MCSPHAAMGDYRSGHELLAACEEDRGRTIASMAASREGRVELETIAAAIEAIVRNR